MALNITRGDEPILVENLSYLIYGQPGTGKTSLAFTAEAPLLLAFDKGTYRAISRKATVQIKSWADVARISASDIQPYKTIIVDTVGSALDFLSAHIIDKNSKMARGDGALSLQGYGALKSTFGNWLKQLNLLGKDVVLIAHDKEDKDGDNKFVRPDITGGSYGEIMKFIDFVGYYYMFNDKRILNFNPCEKFIGKNAAKIPPLEVPEFDADSTYLAELILQTKDILNNKSAAQTDAINLLNKCKAEIAEMTTLEAIEAFAQNMKHMDVSVGLKAQIRAIFTAHYEKLGIAWSKDKSFHYTNAAAPAPAPVAQPEPIKAAAPMPAKPAADVIRPERNTPAPAKVPVNTEFDW